MPVPDNCVDLIVTEVEGCHNDLYEVNHDALNDVRITGLAASFVQVRLAIVTLPNLNLLLLEKKIFFFLAHRTGLCLPRHALRANKERS